MRTILRLKFGSHLYGTNTPNSDLDFKSIFVPDAKDILLQRAPTSIANKRKKVEGEKNYAGEHDEEALSLQKYMELLAEGQTMALDILFSPPSAWVQASSYWHKISANRKRFLTKKSAKYLDYCRSQANKYGIKGSRIADARLALRILTEAEKEHGTTEKLAVLEPTIMATTKCPDFPHLQLDVIEQVSGQRVTYWNVCGRKLGFTSSIKNARECVEKLVAEYGSRALLAEQNNGVDWKALSHAARVGTQALELLNHHTVTFPLPNAEFIKAIKLGRYPYKFVADQIEQLMVAIEEAAAKSTLPDGPDVQWMEDFVAGVYADEIAHAHGLRAMGWDDYPPVGAPYHD